jgi:DNA helicase-2/ATP-dependent DNA helicase PcrA
VGITRAGKRVYLVRAFRRHLMGSSAVNQPSRFLKDIPPQLIASRSVEEGEADLALAMAKEREPVIQVDLPEFRPGEHVKHEQFGEGVVVSYQRVKTDAEVVVAFDGAGVKRFLLSFARIEKV